MTDVPTQPPADVNQQAKNAIVKREEDHKQEVVSLTGLVEKRAAEIYNDDRAKEFAGSLTAAAERNPKLKQCKTSSILAAMVACVQLDLMPNTSQGFAYLIPYKNEVQFQLGYKGLIELCYRSGEVSSISAELVFPEDDFDFAFGTERYIKHKPDMTRDRTRLDEATHVYSTAVLKNGSTVFDIMSISEINKIRKNIKAKSTDAPWVTWPEQMAKKTAIKRLTKYLPQSKTDRRVAMAVQYDNWAEAGRLIYKDGQLVEGTPDSSALPDQPKRELKALAQPPENLIDEPTTKSVEDENPVIPVEVVEEDAKQEEASQEMNEQEYRDEIEDMMVFLKINKHNEMQIVNEFAKTPLLSKVKLPELKEIHKHLTDMAEAKTELAAAKEQESIQE